jgi:hypothetical protein
MIHARRLIPSSVFALVLLLAASAQAEDFLHFDGAAGPGKGKHVVLIAGDDEYRSEEALPMLGKILSQRHGFACTVLFPAGADGVIKPGDHSLLSHPEALDTADAIVMLVRFRSWNDAAMKRFEAAYLRGVPIIALRTSTHAFDFANGPWKKWTWNGGGEWPGGFGKQVLGETWVAHHGEHKKQGCRAVIEVVNKDHPVLRSVADVFTATDVYAANPPADYTVLLRGAVTESLDPDSKPVAGAKNTPMQPIAWVRERVNEAGKTNRILTTTMGAASDLVNEDLRRLVVNGVFWGLGLEVPAKADVTLVDGYSPSFYGFNGERTGLTVAELGLGKALPPPPIKGK